MIAEEANRLIAAVDISTLDQEQIDEYLGLCETFKILLEPQHVVRARKLPMVFI